MQIIKTNKDNRNYIREQLKKILILSNKFNSFYIDKNNKLKYLFHPLSFLLKFKKDFFILNWLEKDLIELNSVGILPYTLFYFLNNSSKLKELKKLEQLKESNLNLDTELDIQTQTQTKTEPEIILNNTPNANLNANAKNITNYTLNNDIFNSDIFNSDIFNKIKSDLLSKNIKDVNLINFNSKLETLNSYQINTFNQYVLNDIEIKLNSSYSLNEFHLNDVYFISSRLFEIKHILNPNSLNIENKNLVLFIDLNKVDYSNLLIQIKNQEFSYNNLILINSSNIGEEQKLDLLALSGCIEYDLFQTKSLNSFYKGHLEYIKINNNNSLCLKPDWTGNNNLLMFNRLKYCNESQKNKLTFSNIEINIPNIYDENDFNLMLFFKSQSDCNLSSSSHSLSCLNSLYIVYNNLIIPKIHYELFINKINRIESYINEISTIINN